MAGVEGPVSANVQAFDGRFSAKDVMLELSSMGVGAGVDPGEPVRLRSKAPTVQRRVLFLDGDFAGETRTVDVGADGVFAGRFVKSWRNGERVHYEVEYRVEEVQLGFGDTVFLGFVPVDERPSWPQRVADALAFIEAETAAFLERDRQKRCRHHRKAKSLEPTVEDPHRYQTVCEDCGWSVLFEGPDTCSFCRGEPLPWPHPDRPDTGLMFCEHCGNQHEVSRKHTA
jgi:hypothetical protein